MKHAVLLGIVVLVVWELAVSWIPAPAARGTVSFHARSLLSHATDEGGDLAQWIGMFRTLDLVPSPAASVIALLAASVIQLSLAALVYARREYQEKPGDA